MGATPGMPEYMSIGDRLKRLESQVDKLNRMTRLESASIGAGGLTVKDGGQIAVLDAAGNTIVVFDVDGATIHEADGSILIALDGTGLRLNDAAGAKLIDLTTAGLKAYSGVNLLVQVNASGVTIFEADGSTLAVLDGTKLRYNRSDGTRSLEITPGGGLKIYAANGTTEQVVLDADGLEVFGGMITPLWINDQADFTSDASLTTTFATFNSVTFSPPSWVQTLFVEITLFGQITDDGDGDQLQTQIAGGTTANSGFNIRTASATVTTNAASRTIHRTYTTFPVTIEQEASVAAGTNGSNRLDLVARAVGVRD